MRPGLAYPYLLANEEVIHADPWRVTRIGSQESEYVEGEIRGWDYQEDLNFERMITIECRRVRESCGLADDVELHVVGSWYCPGSTLRGRGTRTAVPMDEEAEIACCIKLDGRDLSDRIVLSCDLVLGRTTGRSGHLAAKLHASRLWSDESLFLIEGSGSRFATVAQDFAHLPQIREKGAAWYLDWAPERLDLPYASACRLYLNSAHPAIKSALADHDPMILSALRFDVGRRLILGGLTRAELPETRAELEDAGFEEGTLGVALWRLIRSCFPNETFQSLKGQLDNDPEQFESRLQGALELFRA